MRRNRRMGEKHGKQEENRKRSELIKSRKKRPPSQLNKNGIPAEGQRKPRQRFIYGEQV